MTGSESEATWSIEPHTEAKLAILAAYLRAWFPILSHGGFKRAIYIDGFAGPGRYEGGQDGSPLLALKALAAQPKRLSASFEFHFVELDPGRCSSLNANLNHLRQAGAVSPNAAIHVHEQQAFQQAYEAAIKPRLQAHPNAPAFALVDPFGWTGIPMSIHTELLRRSSTELLVNFMFEEINRFLGHQDQPRNFDALFGCPNWRAALQLTGTQRRRYLHDLYRDQLRISGRARYVRSFEMRNSRGLVDYFLFFATNSLKGLAKMKEAMWRVDPSGGFTFSDATDPNQPALFGSEPDYGMLGRSLGKRFSGQSARRGEIEEFVVEHTPFLASHYKRVLKQMEAAGRIRPVNAPPDRRAGTYDDANLVFSFA